MQNDPTALFALIAGVLVLLAVAIAVSRKHGRERSAALREHFGPEYDRAVAQYGGEAKAERALAARRKRMDKLDIRLLSAEQCARFGAAWAAIQQRFVDDPSGAVMEADGLVKEVMSARGYPMGNFEQRVADLSVEHADVVGQYRAARTIAFANAKGEASTEELRQAMVHYRALFNDLLQAEDVSAQVSDERVSEARA